MDRRYIPLRPATPKPSLEGVDLAETEGPGLKRRRTSVSVACNTCRHRKIRVCINIVLTADSWLATSLGLNPFNELAVRWQAPRLYKLSRVDQPMCLQR